MTDRPEPTPSAASVRPSHSTRPGSSRASWLDAAMGDLRQAVRALAAGRGFTGTVLVTLMVCIGAAVAVFSVFHAVVLSPLPFDGADRLVVLSNAYPGAGVERTKSSVPDYFDRREQVGAFEQVAIFRTDSRILSGGEAGEGAGGGAAGDRPERVLVGRATPSLFPLLRVRAERGRLFIPFTDGATGAGDDQQVLLTDRLWHRRFGASPDVIGRVLRLDGTELTVVGVLPPGFALPGIAADLWTPAVFGPEERSVAARTSLSWYMLARLAPGATLEQARAQVDALNERNLDRFPQLKQPLLDARFHTLVEPWRDVLVRTIRPRLRLLLGGALFVLLIGCVNVAGLVLVRSTARSRELATRAALGAGRLQVARQLVVESLLLTLAGGALGLEAGAGALLLLSGLGLEAIPRGAAVGLDATVMLWTLAVSLALGIVFGLIPVVQVFRHDLASIFRQTGSTASSGRGAVLARRLLVMAQVAFAFILLVGAGFLLASFVRTAAVDPGFRVPGVLTARVALPEARYGAPSDRVAFSERLLGAARSLPGVTSAALAQSPPFGGRFNQTPLTVEGYTPPPGQSIRAAYVNSVSPGYFRTLEIPLLAGRTFDERETADSRRVVVIDRWLAERYWPDWRRTGDAVGGRIRFGTLSEGEEPTWWTVVGVVDRIVATDLTGDSNRGRVYFDVAQQPPGGLAVVLATERSPDAVTSDLRAALGRLDPELPLYDVRTMRQRIDDSLLDARLPMLLAAIFAVVALFLSAVGIYGVLAYAVVQRTRELGIRVALGSSKGEIFRLVLRQGLVILGVGLAVGAVGSFWLTRSLAGLLYGVSALDPPIFAAVLGLLGLIVLLATVLPARSATRVDPITALSSE